MDKILVEILQKNSQSGFTAKFFDDFGNSKKYAVNDTIYEVKISNQLIFEVGDLLNVEIRCVEGNCISGVAKKYNRTDADETILWDI